GIRGMAAAQAAWLGLGAGSRVLQLASPSFDASVWELCAALLSGAALVLAPVADPLSALSDPTARVTHATVPPSALATVAASSCPVTTLVVAGEACPAGLVDRWAPGRR